MSFIRRAAVVAGAVAIGLVTLQGPAQADTSWGYVYQPADTSWGYSVTPQADTSWGYSVTPLADTSWGY